MPTVTEKPRVPPVKRIPAPATHVISPTGTVAEKVAVGEASELLRRRDAQATRLKQAREELEELSRAQGVNSAALATADGLVQSFWAQAIAANIDGLKKMPPGSDDKSAVKLFPAGRSGDTRVPELLHEIGRLEIEKRLATQTDIELHKRIVAAHIAVLTEEASLKSVASRYIRAAAAERISAIDLTAAVDSESEVTIHSKRVDQELAIADSLSREVAALDIKRKELEVLYRKMEGL
jgi:hypothetical protein